MQKIILLILLTSLLSGCGSLMGVALGNHLRNSDLMNFANKHDLSFPCVSNEVRKFEKPWIGPYFALRNNKKIIIEKCKIHSIEIEANDYEK